MLHALGGALCLLIVAVDVVFVEGQRRDAYYRNDPSKYGLTSNLHNKLRVPLCVLNHLWVKQSSLRMCSRYFFAQDSAFEKLLIEEQWQQVFG